MRLHLERDKLRSGGQKREAKERARNIGIVGAGTRGMALITMAVTRGFQVTVREPDATALGFAMFHVLTVLQEEVARGALTPADLKRYLGNIHATTTWKGFDELDLVLETGEDQPSKKVALFREIEQQTNPRTLLVTTGATVSSADLQQEAGRPQNVGALHFLPPINRSLLVEVPTTEKSPLDTTRRLLDFVVALGRAPQQVKDLPGFLVQRLLLPYFNEAILLVKEGFNPLYVDEAMTRFGMSQGPLEQLDLLGLDAAFALVQALTPVLEKRLIFDQTFATMTERRGSVKRPSLAFTVIGTRNMGAPNERYIKPRFSRCSRSRMRTPLTSWKQWREGAARTCPAPVGLAHGQRSGLVSGRRPCRIRGGTGPRLDAGRLGASPGWTIAVRSVCRRRVHASGA